MKKTQIAQGAIYLTIASFMFLISGYAINIWLGRHLGPETYGVYGIIISLVTVINLTQTAGLPFAVSKYVASNNETANAIYNTGFFIQLISTCVAAFLFYFASGMIAKLLNDTELIPYLQLASLIFPFYGLFALVNGYYNGLHLFKKQAFLHTAYSLLKIFFVILLAIPFHLYGVIVGFIVSPIIALITGFHLPKFTTATFPYKKLIVFSLPLIGIALFSNLLQSVDLFFVKALMESEKAPGFYTAGQNISRIPFFAFSALSLVLLPSIARTVSQKLEGETQKLITNSLRAVILLGTPLVFIMSATSRELLDLIYSSQYTPAAESLSILLIGMGFLTIFTVQSNILAGAGKPKTPLLIAISSVLATIIFCVFFIPILGLNGAALATTIGSFIAMFLASIIVYKQFGTFVPLKSALRIFSTSLLIYTLAKLLIVPLFFLPFLYVFLFMLYFLILFVCKEVTRRDIILVKKIIL